MTFAQLRQSRAVEYRRLAGVQSALMQTSTLPLVRDKHELAAAKWSALAALDEQPTAQADAGRE